MARQQTRTTGGAYQNPTEGIVDYGAFARGFASTFRMPEEEEEAEYQRVSGLEVDPVLNEGGSKGLTEGTAIAINDSFSDLAKELRFKVKDGKKTVIDISNNNTDGTKNLNLLIKTKNGLELLFGKGLENSEAVDWVHQDSSVGSNNFGQTLSYGTLLSTEFQKNVLRERKKGTKGADFKIEFKEVDGVKVGGINIAGYFIPASNITEDTINKYLPPKDNSDQVLDDRNKKIADNIKAFTKKETVQTISLVNGKKISESKQIDKVTEDSYTSIDAATLDVANSIVLDSRGDETFSAIYRNVLYGVGTRKSPNAYINNPNLAGGIEFGGETYAIEEFFKENENDGTLGNVPFGAKEALVKKYIQDKHKTRYYPSAYVPNKYGGSQKTADLIDTSKKTEDVDKEGRQASDLGKSVGISFAKMPGNIIKDSRISNSIKLLNEAYPNTRAGRFADIPTAKTLYENAYIEQMNPVPDDEKETRLVAQRKFNDLMSKYKGSEIIFINDKNEVIGVDIRSIESIGKSLAEAYGIKNPADKQIFIDGFVNAQSKKQSKNENPLLQE